MSKRKILRAYTAVLAPGVELVADVWYDRGGNFPAECRLVPRGYALTLRVIRVETKQDAPHIRVEHFFPAKSERHFLALATRFSAAKLAKLTAEVKLVCECEDTRLNTFTHDGFAHFQAHALNALTSGKKAKH